MKKFFTLHKKQISLITGVLLFLILFFINPLALLPKAKIVLAVAMLMISWWVFDALPLAVVALMPIILFPLFDISPMKEVTKSYADSIIFLFMGGFFIGIAIEKWNLHKRIALNLIKKTGTNGNKIILGFIISTGFLSLWLSNTATTMMMYPIALSVIHIIEMNEPNEKNRRNFSIVLMLCIAYASNFALGTIIGTPPNVAYVNYISDKFNYNIGFTDWMIVFMPLTILLLLALYWVMVRWLFPNNIKHNESSAEYINEEVSKLGKMSLAEKRTCYVFVITVLLWIFKDLLNSIQNTIQLDDTIIALMGAVSLFIIPADEKHEQSLLSWEDTSKMAWGILLLFGGGIALAKALEDVKLMDQLGGYIASYSTGNVLMMILIVTTFSVFLSEVMGNVAQVIVMAPVVSSVAVSLHMDPLMLGIPMTLGASCASMLPMGTPPNAIVFASGHIKMKDMIRSGFVLNIISIIIITLFCYFIQPLIMKLAI